MADETNKPLFLRILPDLLAFAIGLSVAYFLQWQTRDLVWSLWLCSLVLGYLTLLSAIGGGAYLGIRALLHPAFTKKWRLPAALIGIAGGFFFLGFFSLHFCGFHAGHSVFLRQFFPIEGLPSDGFGRAFMNPPLLWVLVFKHLLKPYGMFLIPAIIAERKYVFRPFVSAVQAVQANQRPTGPEEGRADGRKSGNRLGDAMSRPYINVVRMHLLIFFFAFCHFLKVDSFLVYAVVYFVYFFPWSEIKALTAKAAILSRQPVAGRPGSA